MNAFERKVALRVTGIHVAVVLGIMVVAGLKGCLRPKPKPEIVTIVEWGSPAPPVAVSEVSEMQDPAPPDPEPPPVAPPEEVVPEQPKKRIDPPKRQIEPPKKKDPEKKKPTYAGPEDIKIGPRVEVKDPKPLIPEREIQQALSGITQPDGPVGNPDEFAAYDSRIYTIFYSAWKRPATSAARPAKVKVAIQSNGRITARRLIQESGDAAFDKTVMDVVNSVSVLPWPPAGYPLDNIVVQFRIID